MSGPLAGVRILDLTQALAGPFCTMLLADLGADVIKIEPPGGDMSRPMPPHPKDRTACDYGGYFASINRGKRSIVLDLKQPAERDVFLRLADGADAVVENARVGVMDRLGVGYDVLHARRPGLVYAAIRGFGDPRTGVSPYAEWPAFDIVAQSMGGMVGITGALGSHGQPCGASVGDLFPGTLCALGIVSAVLHARATGEGQFLDVAMYDAVLALCETVVHNYSYAGEELGPRGSGHPSLCPFDVYETSDGAVAIAAPLNAQWRTLCKAMGRLDLVDDPRAKDPNLRAANRPALNEAVTRWTKAHTKREIVEALAGQVPVGPVHTAADLFADPHLAARGMLAEIELPGGGQRVRLAGPPIKLTRTPSGVQRPPPTLGQHGAEILAEAGITPPPKETT